MDVNLILRIIIIIILSVYSFYDIINESIFSTQTSIFLYIYTN
jgi:hypothetical protein